jgi:hypothetical protein
MDMATIIMVIHIKIIHNVLRHWPEIKSRPMFSLDLNIPKYMIFYIKRDYNDSYREEYYS